MKKHEDIKIVTIEQYLKVKLEVIDLRLRAIHSAVMMVGAIIPTIIFGYVLAKMLLTGS